MQRIEIRLHAAQLGRGAIPASPCVRACTALHTSSYFAKHDNLMHTNKRRDILCLN